MDRAYMETIVCKTGTGDCCLFREIGGGGGGGLEIVCYLPVRQFCGLRRRVCCI